MFGLNYDIQGVRIKDMGLRIILILICFFGSIASGVMAQDIRQMSVRLTLKDALQSVDTVNFQVMMANARLEQAIARISQAQSDLLPHLEGDVSGGRQTADLRAEGIQIPGVWDACRPV